MSSREPARTAARPSRSTVLGVLVVVSAALVTALGHQWPTSPSSSLASPSTSPSIAPASSSPIPPTTGSTRPDRAPHVPPPGAARGVLGEADGLVPDGVTVFDDGVPAVAHLDPALLDALRRAASEAAEVGIELTVTSGWRSPAYQEHLLREAVANYGSEAEAARWVATPATSAHVSGEAIDVGPAAATWLSRHGAAFGLCPIYDNEPWHYERRPEAVRRGCPARYPDPTHDPRMQP